MLIEPEIEDVSAVLIGDFNPAIFNPDWLLRNDLVGKVAAEQAEVDVIHAELAQFRVGDFDLIVSRQRLQVTMRTAPFIRVSDFTLKLFREVLPHTPVRQFGLNRSVHFRVGSEETRNKIGRLLAPLEPWGAWGDDIGKGEGDLRGGMASLSMQEVICVDGIRRKITATVQPSSSVQKAFGIFVGLNDHHEFESEKITTKSVIDIFDSSFDKSLAHSEYVIDCVMALKGKCENED